MILKKLKNNNSLKKLNKRISKKKMMHGGNKKNSSGKKQNRRISIKKTMYAGSPTILEGTLALDENFIINTYFNQAAEWFDLKHKYPGMHNDDKWNTELLGQFIDVYNSFFTRLYFRVLFMKEPKSIIEIWPREKPQNILDDEYVAFLLKIRGFIFAPIEISDIIYDLSQKDNDACGIKRIDKYYKKYDDTIGKGAFGTLFRCSESKVIKFINPQSILHNNSRFARYNGIITIINIVEFLNEVNIYIILNRINHVLFKKPHSFGYKCRPIESISTINDGPKEIVLDVEDENYVEPTMFPGKFYIIMDNMGETLENKLTSAIQIEINVKLQYLKNLVDGLTIIHENNFFYSDIKSNNILVGEDNIARFIDFGTSKLITNANTRYDTGTPDWLPSMGKILNLYGNQLLNIDIYALGLVFYFILLEDKYFLKDRPTHTVPSGELYRFFNDKVSEKALKMEEDLGFVRLDITQFYNGIINFIRDNEMLTYEILANIPEPGSECRMKTIQQNFEKLLIWFKSIKLI